MADAKITVKLDLDAARREMQAAAGGGQHAAAVSGAAPGATADAADSWAPDPGLYGGSGDEHRDLADAPSKGGAKDRRSRWLKRGQRARARAARVKRMKKRKRLNRTGGGIYFVDSQHKADLGVGVHVRRSGLWARKGRPMKRSVLARLGRARSKFGAVAQTAGRLAATGGMIAGTAAASYAAVDQTRNIIPLMLPMLKQLLPDFLSEHLGGPVAKKLEAAMDNLQNVRAGVSGFFGTVSTGADVLQAMAQTGTMANSSQLTDVANSIWAVQHAKARGKLEWQEASLSMLGENSVKMFKAILRQQNPGS